MMRTKTFLTRLCLLLATSATLSCSRDPEVAKREYLRSGNKYLQEKKYQEAIIQYRNAIQKDQPDRGSQLNSAAASAGWSNRSNTRAFS